MADSTADKIRELEWKVNVLTGVVVVETLVFSGFFPLFAAGLVLLLPILAFTHQYLPWLARQAGRLIASKRRSSATAQGT